MPGPYNDPEKKQTIHAGSVFMKNLLITGGTLWNGKQFVRGNALLLSGSLIQAAGSEEDVRAAAPSSGPVLRLSGESVLPGITDGHIHLTTWAKQKALLDLSPAGSLPGIALHGEGGGCTNRAGPMDQGMELQRHPLARRSVRHTGRPRLSRHTEPGTSPEGMHPRERSEQQGP